MLINKEGLDLIKFYEGYREYPYTCSGGKLTIGYGHVIKPDEDLQHLTRERALEILKQDVHFAERAVEHLVKVKLNENEFSALVSFVFNLGKYNFKSSTLLKKLNDNKRLECPAEFIRWVYAGDRIQKGLVRRRIAESALFMKQ